MRQFGDTVVARKNQEWDKKLELWASEQGKKNILHLSMAADEGSIEFSIGS